MPRVTAEPYEFEFDPRTSALVVIDMQRDFVYPGGFGEALGNDVTLLQRAVEPTRRVLEAARAAGMLVIHTREGHRADLSDCPPAKLARGHLTTGIGDQGPMGRILVRGEYGHDIVDELKPAPGELVVDKPGKGAFYATDLESTLRNRTIRSLVVTGVTAEVCVQTTVREANDRGFECLVLSDCIASYFPEFYEMTLKMVTAQGGIFGWVAKSEALLAVLKNARSRVNTVDLFVNGTLMRGLALNANLASAEFLEACETAPRYRLYSIDNVHPGMFEVEVGGIAVPGELYRVPDAILERVEASEPPGLYRGPVHLSDGRVVQGILYPRHLAEGLHQDISAFGGWRSYVTDRS